MGCWNGYHPGDQERMPCKLGGGSLIEAVSFQNQLQSKHVVDCKGRCFHCWMIVSWRQDCSVKIA